MKRSLLVFLVVAAALLSTSCDKLLNYLSLVGTWDAVQMEYKEGGKTVITEVSGFYYVLEANHNLISGTVVSPTQTLEEQGTWKKDGDRLLISINRGGVISTTTYTIVSHSDRYLALYGPLYEGVISSPEGTITYKRLK